MNHRTFELLVEIGKLIRAIDNEADWLIISFNEKDQKRRALARILFNQKQKERVQLAKEAYERFK